MSRNIRLTLTPIEFLVIYEFLSNVRLGRNNKYQCAVTTLLNELEELDVECLLDEIVQDHERPLIGVSEEEDGLEFVLH